MDQQLHDCRRQLSALAVIVVQIANSTCPAALLVFCPACRNGTFASVLSTED